MLKFLFRVTFVGSVLSASTAMADQCRDVLIGLYDQSLYESRSSKREAMYQHVCENVGGGLGFELSDIGVALDYAKSKCSSSANSLEWLEQIRSVALSVNPNTIDAWNQCMNRNGMHVSLYKKAVNVYTIAMNYRPADPASVACVAGGVGGFNVAYGGRMTALGSPSKFNDAEWYPQDCDRTVSAYVRKEWTLVFEDPGVAVIDLGFSNVSTSSSTNFYVDTR